LRQSIFGEAHHQAGLLDLDEVNEQTTTVKMDLLDLKIGEEVKENSSNGF
jgi:hypothetical protein